jgi:hypothetical protein
MGISSVSFDPDGFCSSPHGPEFVGIYMRLLEKYMGLNLLVLMATANNSKVDFNVMAVPTVLDV